MPREVAHTYLRAVAEAWPFASESAYRLRTLHLARTPRLLYDPPTQDLADDLVAWLRPRAAGLSIEALRRQCEHAWFDGDRRRRSLAEVLFDLADRALQPGGHVFHLRRDTDLPERLAHQRWLSLLLPPDLLVAALGPEPPADHVSLLTPQLAEMLAERPVAETHVHLNAAMPFGVVWTGLAGAFMHHAPEPSQIDRASAPLGDPERFLSTLGAAFIGRLLLAHFLQRRDHTGAAGAFGATLDDSVSRLAGQIDWPGGPPGARFALYEAMRRLDGGDGSAALSYPGLRLLYRLLAGPTPTGEAASIAELRQRDPLSGWLPAQPGGPAAETRFAARAIAYLRGAGEEDDAFAQLFWQYQRVRCLTYRHLVQEPGTAGLDWFQQHFNRSSPLRRALARCRLEAALEHARPGVRLGAFEARISPSNTAAEMLDELSDLGRQARGAEADPRWDRPEVGVIAHFLKQRDDGSGARRLHADPRRPNYRVRYGAWGFARLQEAAAIEAVLRDRPQALIFLRGLDVASTELAVPTWAVIPFFRRVREASVHASARLARGGVRDVPPLRATCHAGEDYLRLAEGLRRVHEPIEFDMLDAGDRIGHGFCLGVDPERWARGAAEIMQPREERLDDLLWELDRYARGQIGVDSGRFAHARAEAIRIGRAVYGHDVDVDALIEARRLRHDPSWIAHFGFPFRREVRPQGDDPPAQLLYRYLTSGGVFARGQQVEPVRVTAGEVAFLRAVQSWLRGELARLEITVESNPSSNLLIGDLLSVEEHPSFSMAPLPGHAAPETCPVLLSINTDDPLTFATSLADEYAHLYGALLRSRVPAHDALTWLAARRDHGYRSRFTLARSREG